MSAATSVTAQVVAFDTHLIDYVEFTFAAGEVTVTTQFHIDFAAEPQAGEWLDLLDVKPLLIQCKEGRVWIDTVVGAAGAETLIFTHGALRVMAPAEVCRAAIKHIAAETDRMVVLRAMSRPTVSAVVATGGDGGHGGRIRITYVSFTFVRGENIAEIFVRYPDGGPSVDDWRALLWPGGSHLKVVAEPHGHWASVTRRGPELVFAGSDARLGPGCPCPCIAPVEACRDAIEYVAAETGRLERLAKIEPFHALV